MPTHTSKPLLATWAALLLAIVDPTPSQGGSSTVRGSGTAADDAGNHTEVRAPGRHTQAPIGLRDAATAFVSQLLAWIAQHSELDYDLEQALPEVRSVGDSEFVDLFLREANAVDVSPTELRAAVRQIAALYHHDSRTIYVHRTVDTASIHGKGALVHELVHFVQYQLGMDRRVECLRALEKDAYQVQAMYLRAHGAEPEFDAFTVAARSFCDPMLE